MWSAICINWQLFFRCLFINRNVSLSVILYKICACYLAFQNWKTKIGFTSSCEGKEAAKKMRVLVVFIVVLTLIVTCSGKVVCLTHFI